MIVRKSSGRSVAASRAGFTLLEVLVVVSILVILASVATFATVKFMNSAKEDTATLQMKNIEQAVKAYHVQSGGSYPQSIEELIQGNPATGAPYLEGGPSAISSPWGGYYNIEVINDSYGSERVVISTQTAAGKRLQWPRNI